MTDNYVELKRTDGSTTVLRILWQMLPRNGGRVLLLVCSYCNTLRRHVYGWDGIASRNGQTESGKSVGDAGLVPGCATLPKAAI
jgi:hypothetical protein